MIALTVDEAIKYQEETLKALPDTMKEEEKETIRLGFEALKRIHLVRLAPWASCIRLLSGEKKTGRWGKKINE